MAEVKRKKAKSGGSDKDTGPVYRKKKKQKLYGDQLRDDETRDLDRRPLKKRKRVYNRATGKFEEDRSVKSRGMGYVVKDILKRVTRGGIDPDKRKREIEKAGG